MPRALEIAAALADSLAAAHGKGIVHRDVKPENVFLTREGRVKLLDFGLARHVGIALEGETNSPTASMLTDAGALMGTVAYMSPEQARGEGVDHRTDQFSLGVVPYELLAGSRPFAGGSAVELLASIVKEEPQPLERKAPGVPAPVRWVVGRCLAKDPADRYESTRDLARELATVRVHLSEAARPSAETSATPGTKTPGRRRVLAATAAAVLLVAAVGAALWLAWSRASGGKAGAAAVPRLVRLTWNMRSRLPSIAPDGNSFAYVSTASEAADEKADIFVRRIGGENPVNLTKGSGANNLEPVYSPDGQTLAFDSDRDGGGIFLMGATGESVRRLTSFGFSPAWSPEGKAIAFSSLYSEGWAWDSVSSLWVADVTTGATRKVFEGDAVRPFWSPSGTRIAFDGRRQGMAGGRALFTVPATGGVPTEVATTPGIGWMSGVWTPGWIWFTNPEKGPPGIWRVRVDEATGKPLGAPEPVLRSTAEISCLSATRGASRLVFLASSREVLMVRWDVDPATGRVGPQARTILDGGRPVYEGVASPDGRWIAARLIDQSNEFREDILLVNESTGEIRRLTDDAFRESAVDWSPDGSRLYFCVSLEGGSELWSIRPDGSGRERVLGTGPVGEVLGVLASPDGRTVYVEAGKSHLPYFLDVKKGGSPATPAPLAAMPDGRVFSASGWSPDGRWLAGVSRKPDGAFEEALVVFDVPGKTYRTIANVKAHYGSCFWLPDSRRVLVVGDAGDLTVFDRETGSVTQAGSIGRDAYNLSLSRDGRGLYANKGGRPMIDVWMLDFGVKP